MIKHNFLKWARLELLLTRHAWFISIIIVGVRKCSLALVMVVVIVPFMLTITIREVSTRKAYLCFIYKLNFKTCPLMFDNKTIKVPNETNHEWRRKLWAVTYLWQFSSLEGIITMSRASDLSFKCLFHGYRCSRGFRRGAKFPIYFSGFKLILYITVIRIKIVNVQYLFNFSRNRLRNRLIFWLYPRLLNQVTCAREYTKFSL